MRATALMYKLSGFKFIKHVDIPVIPTERTLFPGTKNDWWYAVNIPLLDMTACIYELDVDSVFTPHIHNISSERIIALDADSKIKAVTFDYIKEYVSNEVMFFEKGEAHAVINMTGKMVKLLVLWSPKMNGWQGDFLPDFDVNITPA